MFPVGNWILGNDYGILDIVYHEGSSYIAKNNIINSTTPPPDDPTNWQIHARGFGADALSEISAEDTSGVLGTTGAVVASQDLLDAIADKVMTKLIPYTNIANNFLATDPKTVLSGPMGKSLKDQLDTTNSNLNNQTITSSGLNLTWGSVNSGGYTVIGNIVIINIRIAINTSLSAGTEYLISGFPSPKGLSANSIAVSCSHHSLTAICYLGVQGLLSFNPSSAISSGTSLFFSAFYIKQ